jgi:hypothetical protein
MLARLSIYSPLSPHAFLERLILRFRGKHNVSDLSIRQAQIVTSARRVADVQNEKSKGRNKEPTLTQSHACALRDTIEVAKLDAGDKLTPLIKRELTGRSFKVIGISDEDRFALTCHSNALAAVASA